MNLLLLAVLAAVCGASDYDVTWNGRSLALEDARISSWPINRLWCGKQRPLEQTRPAKFVTFDVRERDELDVRLPADAPRVRVFPISRQRLVRQDGTRLSVDIARPERLIFDFGTNLPPLHVFANPPDSPPSRSGKVRWFGPGRHEAGVIVPDSGETIYLEEGAVVHGALFVDRARDVRVCGRGIFDFSSFGRCDPRISKVRQERGYPAVDTEFACGAFVVNASTNVTIEGVILRDAPFWNCIVRGRSRDVLIDNVKVVGAWRYNADGIDVAGCENVTVRNCFVRSFDDCTVVLDGYLDGCAEDSRNVVFEDNVLWCDWGAVLKIWGGKYDSDISGVTFRRNIVAPCECGFNFHCQLGCPRFTVRDVTVEDVEVDLYGPLPRTRIQWKDSDAWPDEWRDWMPFLLVDVGWPKRDTGNQGRANMSKEEAARTSREFDGICFRNVRFPGTMPKLKGRIRTEGPNQRIGEIRLDGVPSIEFDRNN